MNPRSDVDFTSPKLDLIVNLSEVAIELNRPQVCVCVYCAKHCLYKSLVEMWAFFKEEEEKLC